MAAHMCRYVRVVSTPRLVRCSKDRTDRRSYDDADRNANADRVTASDHGSDHNADDDADPDGQSHELHIVIHDSLSVHKPCFVTYSQANPGL